MNDYSSAADVVNNSDAKADLSDGLELDTRRRRLKFRVWHRGMREMDLIFGPFADSEMDKLSEDEVAEFERMSELQDVDLFSWFSAGEAPAPHDTPLFRRIKAFHTHTSPVNV